MLYSGFMRYQNFKATFIEDTLIHCLFKYTENFTTKK